MKTFTDSTGRTWTVAVTIGSARRVRDLTGVNLLAPTLGDPPLMTLLAIDPLLQAEVLYAVCKPQADAAEITEAAFYELIATEIMPAAATALLEDLQGFFRGLGRGETADAIAANVELIAAGLAAMGAKATARLTRGTSSGATPAPPASTPAG